MGAFRLLSIADGRQCRAGLTPVMAVPGHVAIGSTPAGWPVLLGYNRAVTKPAATVIPRRQRFANGGPHGGRATCASLHLRRRAALGTAHVRGIAVSRGAVGADGRLGNVASLMVRWGQSLPGARNKDRECNSNQPPISPIALEPGVTWAPCWSVAALTSRYSSRRTTSCAALTFPWIERPHISRRPIGPLRLLLHPPRSSRPGMDEVCRQRGRSVK